MQTVHSLTYDNRTYTMTYDENVDYEEETVVVTDSVGKDVGKLRVNMMHCTADWTFKGTVYKLDFDELHDDLQDIESEFSCSQIEAVGYWILKQEN